MTSCNNDSIAFWYAGYLKQPLDDLLFCSDRKEQQINFDRKKSK